MATPPQSGRPGSGAWRPLYPWGLNNRRSGFQGRSDNRGFFDAPWIFSLRSPCAGYDAPVNHSNTTNQNGTGTASHGVSKDLVYRLVDSVLAEPRTRHLGTTLLPNKDAVEEIVELVRTLMFPGYFGRRGLTEQTIGLHIEELVSQITLCLREQISSVLRYTSDGRTNECDGSANHETCAKRATELTEIGRAHV